MASRAPSGKAESGLLALFPSSGAAPPTCGGLAQAQLLTWELESTPPHPHPQGFRQSIRIGSTRLSKRPALMRMPEGDAACGRHWAELGWARPGQG